MTCTQNIPNCAQQNTGPSPSNPDELEEVTQSSPRSDAPTSTTGTTNRLVHKKEPKSTGSPNDEKPLIDPNCLCGKPHPCAAHGPFIAASRVEFNAFLLMRLLADAPNPESPTWGKKRSA